MEARILISNIALGCGQITGTRPNQQDCWKVALGETASILIVADGMGGHNAGEQASRLVVKAVAEAFSQPWDDPADMLRQALQQANQAVADFAQEHGESKGLGSTLLAVLLMDEQLHWLSVGDSPLWLLRDGELRRLNKDHSMQPVLLRMAALGEITQAEALADPNRHLLRSAVSGGEIRLVDVSESPLTLLPGDALLLASDGVATLDDAALCGLLESPSDVQVVVDALLAEVEAAALADQDNCSLILARVGERDA